MLHRIIYERMHGVTLSEWEEIGHRDGNVLNNQRQNLERRTWSQHSQRKKMLRSNTSSYSGISWHVRKKRWRASIKVQGKALHLGQFTSVKEAAIAYNEAAIQYFGPKAQINRLVPE